MNKNEHEYYIAIAETLLNKTILYSNPINKKSTPKEYIFKNYAKGIGLSENGEEVRYKNVYAYLLDAKTNKVKRCSLKQVIIQNK